MKHHALALALSIALCAHITIYALLSLWSAPIPDNSEKSIPVTLIVSPDSVASKATKQVESSRKSSFSDLLTTKGQTDQRVKATENPDEKPPSKSTNDSATGNSIEQRQTASQLSRQRNQAASIKQLFSSTARDMPAIKAVQTSQNEQMSAYEIELLSHLLSGQLYDDFHRFMEKATKNQINFTIQLSLFSNGAIKSAKLVSKDQDLPIERLAVTAAYNASPYPRPPDKDVSSNFTYSVSMSYSENALH